MSEVTIRYFFLYQIDATNCDRYVKVLIPAHRDRNQDRTRQLMREIKHTIIYQGLIFEQGGMNFMKVFVSLGVVVYGGIGNQVYQ